MGQKYNLSFFTGRIKEIGSALMHDLGDYDEKIPSDIINVIKADEKGRSGRDTSGGVSCGLKS